MKLFVPELGTKLQLTKDWKFTLYCERRNDSLAYAKGYKQYHAYSRGITDIWIPIEVETPDWTEFIKGKDTRPGEAWRQVREEWEDLNIKWLDSVGAVKTNELEITLEKGAVLTVDRIYIRKGAKDFSSISFWLKYDSITIPSRYTRKETKRGIRFWAKLNDCNNIEFNLVD